MKCYSQREKNVHQRNTEQFSEVRQVKKKISLLLCVLVASISFVGCSGKGAEGISGEQQDNAKVISEYMVSMFTSMGDEGLAQFMEMSDYELNYQPHPPQVEHEPEQFACAAGSQVAGSSPLTTIERSCIT